MKQNQFNKMKNFPNIIQSQHSSKANSRNINRGSGSGLTGPMLGAKTFYGQNNNALSISNIKSIDGVPELH